MKVIQLFKDCFSLKSREGVVKMKTFQNSMTIYLMILLTIVVIMILK